MYTVDWLLKGKKGFSHFYSLLNVNAKRDGWVRCGVKLEEEGIDVSMMSLKS